MEIRIFIQTNQNGASWSQRLLFKNTSSDCIAQGAQRSAMR